VWMQLKERELLVITSRREESACARPVVASNDDYEESIR
jgi:hypothetical protein